MNKCKMIRGPFGQYVPGSTGAILNMCSIQENIPPLIVENLTILNDEIKYYGNLVGIYKWLEGYSSPMFCWQDKDFLRYNENLLTYVDTIYKPKFRAMLSKNLLPAFVVKDKMATPKLHDFLSDMFAAKQTTLVRKIVDDSGAIFKEGANDCNSRLFVIEFWKLAGIKAFIDYLNDNYIYTPYELGLEH